MSRRTSAGHAAFEESWLRFARFPFQDWHPGRCPAFYTRTQAARKTTRVTHAVARSSDRFETLCAQARNRPEARRPGESPLPAPVPPDHWVSLQTEKIRRILTCLVPSAH